MFVLITGNYVYNTLIIGKKLLRVGFTWGTKHQITRP